MESPDNINISFFLKENSQHRDMLWIFHPMTIQCLPQSALLKANPSLPNLANKTLWMVNFGKPSVALTVCFCHWLADFKQMQLAQIHTEPSDSLVISTLWDPWQFPNKCLKLKLINALLSDVERIGSDMSCKELFTISKYTTPVFTALTNCILE
jgi:hypothetical protein